MLAKPEVIAGVMHQAAELDEHGKHLKLPAVQQAFDDLTNVWDVMFPVERYKFINEVVKKITVHIDRVELEYKTDGLEAVITEAEAVNGKTIERLVNGNIKVTIPIRLKYDGCKTVIQQPEVEQTELDPETMSPLQKAVIQGFQYRDMLESGKVATVSELAQKVKQERAFLFRALSLVNLAPDIIEAILNQAHVIQAPQRLPRRLDRAAEDVWDIN